MGSTNVARMMTSSTLVETVSINYEDFNESFLTCSTCLCTYDAQEHTPKLLSCSHTVCRHCLERIVIATGARDAGSFRCPICRETIPLPRGGVGALPPSFLVNQLLDLMSRQRREVVPKCSGHPSEELLFCETCDCVFCSVCTEGSHGNGSNTCSHTVIPFSIAIKRMSEILLYKAHLCINKLNKAADCINNEIVKLDQNADHIFEQVNTSFQEIVNLMENRRQEVLSLVKRMRDEKRGVLQEQLTIINAEKTKVEQECNGLQYQVEVRNITKKIGDLNDKISAVNNLSDPRENSFMKYTYESNSSLTDIQNALQVFGQLSTSRTFPSLCSVDLKDCPAHLEATCTLKTVDYNGRAQASGGDPVSVELQHESKKIIPTDIIDKNNGVYEIKFRPELKGIYELKISVLDRPVKDSPFTFNATGNINPDFTFGSRGGGDEEFLQPVSVVVCKKNNIYVLDTGNCRIKVLSPTSKFIQNFINVGTEDRGGTGLALSPNNTLLVVNWRSKLVTEVNMDGIMVGKFTCQEFEEPTAIAVNSKNEILVVDTSLKCIFHFDSSGKLLRKISKDKSGLRQFAPISSVAIGPNNEVLVADSTIHVFSRQGEYLRDIYVEGKGKGRFGGLTVDSHGNLLASRSDKTKSNIMVFDFATGNLKFTIESQDRKLKRPTGLSVMSNYQVVVVDLGNDCIKKYRYR